MNSREQKLWKKLKAFSLDEPKATFSFSQRLARENGWTAEYTEQVIEEYKRFLFLCCSTSEQLTPSPAVDQVWHLHMVYTHSYWNDLCGAILERELHHNPTQGGRSEAQKYRNCYEQTLQQYRLKFGKDAPSDIWPDVKNRFAEENLRWVDNDRYLLLPKKLVLATVKSCLVLIIVGLGFAIAGLHLSSALWVIVLLCMIALMVVHHYGEPSTGMHISGDGGCGGGIESVYSSDSGDSGCSGDGGCSSGCSGCSGCN